MNTDNPLRIFTPKQLISIDLSSLKRLKKEILLEFQLTNDSTIVLNGVEVDKNSILEIFEELNQKLPLYKFIYENKTLNNFINQGKLTLFEDNKTIEKIKNLGEYKSDVEQKIVAKLKLILAKLIMKPAHGNYDLRMAHKFVNSLNPELISEAYSEAYTKLKNHLDYLEETFKTPFSGLHNTNFNFDIRKHVNVNFYNTITSLPDVFNPLIRQYCRWCNDNVVYEALSREKSFQKYSKDALITIKNAATIASNINNKEGNLKIANSIQAYLDGTRSQRGSSPEGPSVWTVLIAIFFFIRIVFFIGKCSNDSAYDTRFDVETYQYNRGKQDPNAGETIKRILELQREQTSKNNGRQKLTKDFTGDLTAAMNPKLVKQNDYESLTELYFNVDAIPGKYNYFYKLIPPELAKKHKGKIWPVVFSFKHPDIKGSTLEHRLRYDFNSKSPIYPQDYNFKKSESDDDLNLSIKRIPYTSYPLNGVLSRVNPFSGKEKHATKFTIKYQKKTKEFIVTLKSSNTKYTFSKAYISDLNIEKAIEEKDKFAIAIKNINTLTNKYLNQGNFYTLKDILYYSIDPSTANDFPSNQIKSEDAFLRFYITSGEDNTSYVELKGDNVNFKFYADFSTGITKGMTMVTTDSKASEIERMVIFSSK